MFSTISYLFFYIYSCFKPLVIDSFYIYSCFKPLVIYSFIFIHYLSTTDNLAYQALLGKVRVLNH